MGVDTVHLLNSLAYFLIPVELLVSLYYYRKLAVLPRSVMGLFLLLVLNFLVSGAGYLLTALETHNHYWDSITCIVALITALYLLPLVPKVASQMDSYTSNEELVKLNEDFRSPLKSKKYLTRDARVVERKKYGKPKARKSFQFSKR